MASADKEVFTSSLKEVPLNHDALLKLPTAKVREMREAFEILDRDNDGQVTRDDVIDMLTNLGAPILCFYLWFHPLRLILCPNFDQASPPTHPRSPPSFPHYLLTRCPFRPF